MSFWFSEKDSDKDVFENLAGRTVPDSIKHEARQELRDRGYSQKEVESYVWEHDDE